MKLTLRILLAIAILSCFNCNVYAQNQSKKELRLFLDSKQYFNPDAGNYIEFQFLFAGYTVNYLQVENGLKGDVAMAIQISQNDSVIVSDVYRLETPIMRDSVIEDFYDIRRYALKPGVYEFFLEVLDYNSENAALKTSQTIVVDDLQGKTSISDIQIADYIIAGDGTSMFAKSGYDIYPRLSNYFSNDAERLPIYFEIYNTHLLKDGQFGLRQKVIDANTGIEIQDLSFTTKMTCDTVIPIIRQINLLEIPSGNYVVEYSIIDRSSNKVTETAYSFEREKTYLEAITIENTVIDPAFQESITEDSVSFYLASLIPISRPGEVRNIIKILKERTLEDQRKYLQMYWISTAGVKAYDSWIQYKGQVLLVQKLFKTNFQDGFETDRGRVYLQYGAPNQMIQREVSSSEYPYEIWQYYKIGVFSNKRFIFYNPDLISNNYKLLHSDMIGELKNNAWPQILSKRNTTNGNVDDPNNERQDQYGGSSQNVIKQF